MQLARSLASSPAECYRIWDNEAKLMLGRSAKAPAAQQICRSPKSVRARVLRMRYFLPLCAVIPRPFNNVCVDLLSERKRSSPIILFDTATRRSVKFSVCMHSHVLYS